jgi:hypothetical protein
MIRRLVAGASALGFIAAGPAVAATFQPGDSASWWAQIGLTTAIETQAAGGAGTSIALVDTGVVASNPEIAGRVSNLSSCAAVTFTCPSGYTDDNGHGTATASIAAGQYTSKDLMSGVAPAATIVSEKVLNASGSGYDTDVASGITKAANTGAKVISLSLTYIPSTPVISAIDYAASKGAVIVFAGGNSSVPLNGGANSTGLTTQALSQLVFVGSVNATNGLSSFSNTPGSGQAIAGSTQASYASLWLMAPGENIIAPGIQFGAGAYAYWTGTSMAAPMVAGTIALLETTWPVLYRNHDATAVLFQTATDLGAHGVDATYGNGLLNVTKAFQPIGTLSVTTLSGASIPVSQVTSATLTGGALGSLSSIKSLLSNYTAFDTFQRNFSVNLSGLIKVQSGTAAVVATALIPPMTSVVSTTPKGGRLMVATSDMSFMDGPGADSPALSLARQTTGQQGATAFYLGLTTPGGDTAAIGRGLPSTASFADALWGEGALAAYQSNALGVSNALMGLAQGGYFASVGTKIGGRSRLALSWSASPDSSSWGMTPDQNLASSTALGVGLTTRLTARWSMGVTFTALGEKNGLLGTVFDGAGLLNLGSRHQSSSVGFTTALDIGPGRSLLFDATAARTTGSSGLTSGLINSVSPLTARAYGVSFVQADAFRAGDDLTFFVRKPLRVMGGTASIAVTTVDALGYPTTSLVNVGLRPSGDETDFGVGYTAPFRGGVYLNTGLSFRSDADNISGAHDVVARLAVSKSF